MVNKGGRDYFDNPEIWTPLFWQNRTDDIERARLVVNWLPQEISSILDVGCGNGVYTNLQESSRTKIGLDLSRAALKYVSEPRLQASAAELPFANDSFDCCVCMEMLEHLPVAIYQNTLDELKRVTRRYILITVPYNENLYYDNIVCPVCLCRFHPYHHVRQYKEDSFQGLFDGNFILIRLEAVVYKGRKAIPPLWNLIRLYLHRGGRNFPTQVVCPQCGYSSGKSNEKRQLESAPSKGLSIHRYWPELKSHRWWMALYGYDN
jgi:SAM-dependent methyltransferase